MKLIERLKGVDPKIWRFSAIAAVVVVLDQWTKYLTIANLTKAFALSGGDELGFWGRLWTFITYSHPPRDGVYTVMKDFWHFRYVENPGAAWGFLSGAADWFRTPFFITISLVAMVFIVVYFRKAHPAQWALRLALALVFGGAVGNFLDRIRLGYVIDFIDWHWYDLYTWPTFNVADAAISVGVGILILDMIVYRPKSEAGSKGQQDKVGAKPST